MIFYYKVYGLTIGSEIELPEAYEVEEQEVDVRIKYGEMPAFIKAKREQNYLSSILNREYKWFYFNKEGNFLIENGSSITVELDSTADKQHIRALILGACLGSILYQREIVAIHGSAVIWKDKAIIISGNSGAGKSTVSAEFRRRGCGFLADDTVAIEQEGDVIYAHPAYPQCKLCPDAAVRLGYDLNELILVQEDCDKYALRLNNSFSVERKEVAAFIFLNIHDEAHLAVNKINNSTKLEYIVSNLYSYMDCKHAGLNANTFKKCLAMASIVPVIKVDRPRNMNVSEQIVNEILSILEIKDIIMV